MIWKCWKAEGAIQWVFLIFDGRFEFQFLVAVLASIARATSYALPPHATAFAAGLARA